MASSEEVRRVTVVCSGKRKKVKADFGSFDDTMDAVRDAFKLHGTFHLQVEEAGELYDIEGDDDLDSFKDANELIACPATIPQVQATQVQPLNIVERRVAVTFDETKAKKLLKININSFDDAKDAIAQKFKLDPDEIDLSGKPEDEDDYYDIDDDNDWEEYKEAACFMVKRKCSSPRMYSAQQVQKPDQTAEKKLPVTFEGVRKPCSIDMQSYANTLNEVRQRLRIVGDIKILGKLPDSDDYYDIQDDDDLKEFSDAEALRVERVPDPSVQGSTFGAHSTKSMDQARKEIHGSPQPTPIKQAPKPSSFVKVLPVTYAGNCKSVTVDLTSVEATRAAVRQRFKVQNEPNENFKLLAKNNKVNIQFSIDDEDDLEDLEGADALILEKLDEETESNQPSGVPGTMVPIYSSTSQSQQMVLAQSQQLAAPTIEDQALMVRISGEVYTVNEAPRADSVIVLEETKDLAVNFDIPTVVLKTDIVADCLRLANYGVAGNPDLQIKVGKMLSQVAEVSQLTNKSVIQFRMKAGDILEDLTCGFGYLIDGIEDIAMDSFDNVRENSKKMRDRSVTLKEEVEKEKTRVKEILDSIMLADKDRLEEEIKMKKDIEEARKRILQQQVDQAKEDREASDTRVKSLDEEVEEDKGRIKAAMDEKGCGHGCRAGRCCHGSCPCRLFECCYRCCSGGIFCWHPHRRYYWYWGHLHCGDHKADKEKKVTSEKELLKKAEDDRLSEIEERKKRREEEKKANEELLEYIESLKAFDPAEKPEDISTTALRGAENGIRSLQTSLQTTIDFWDKLNDQCESIENAGGNKVVGTLRDKSEEERKRYWSSRTFKMQAVKYYAKWVALRKMCEAFHKGMRGVENNIQISIADKPSIQEARQKIPKLIKDMERKLLDMRTAIEAGQADDDREIQALRSGSTQALTGGSE